MSTGQVFKDVADIFCRLFNHKAAVHGLNQNFVREFEMQDDLISLTHCLNKAEKCSQLLYPATQKGLEAYIQLLGEAVNNTTWACQRILLDESEKKMDWLEQGRVRREQEWDRFIQGQAQARIQHADNEFEVRADGLRRHYADLEERLSQGAVGRLL